MLSSGKCISLGRIRRFKHVVVSEGPKQSVVKSYESYKWTQVLSSQQRILLRGKMHLIRES